MDSLWRDSRILRQADLPAENQDTLTSGWQVGPARSLLLAGLYGPGWRTDWPQQDVAQHEFEVNDVFISGLGLPVERDRFLVGMASRARTFTYLALEAAQSFECSELLVAVIGIGVDDDFLTQGATVKLFTRRGRYPQSFDDLERFHLEAMAVVDIQDL
jgi:hypothetical protein